MCFPKLKKYKKEKFIKTKGFERLRIKNSLHDICYAWRTQAKKQKWLRNLISNNLMKSSKFSELHAFSLWKDISFDSHLTDRTKSELSHLKSWTTLEEDIKSSTSHLDYQEHISSLSAHKSQYHLQKYLLHRLKTTYISLLSHHFCKWKHSITILPSLPIVQPRHLSLSDAFSRWTSVSTNLTVTFLTHSLKEYKFASSQIHKLKQVSLNKHSEHLKKLTTRRTGVAKVHTAYVVKLEQTIEVISNFY